VLNVLSQLATRFRTKIGESLATVQQHSTPLAEATTSSLEALKAYSMAMAIVANQPAAIPLLKRAVEIDPNFAMAYARLALFYSGQGESALGEENIRKAYELRDHAADRELFYISTIYDRQVTGNLEKEIATLRLWAQTYPRDQQAHGLQGGYYAAGTGQWELMVEKSKEAVDIGPDPAAAYGSVVLGEIAVGRLKEAEEFLHLALGRSPDAPNIMMLEYALAFLKGDDAAMEHVAAGAKGKPGAEDLISHVQSLALARAGRLERAREAARHSIELESPGQSERIAVWETGQAIWEALYGNAADAKRHALPALENVKTRHVAYAAALALALAGDGVVAQNVADDLEKRFPEDTSVRFAYVPTLRALAALNANDPARAIELLRAASRYEFAQPGIAFYGTGGGGVGAMYATYLRGQAYLALHRGSDAAAEFQKILDHPGVVLEDPIGGFARLQLARALTMAGDAGKAKAAYEDLLALWKEADPDLARPKQAKAEFAALR